MLIKVPYKIGQSLYLKNDPEQVEYRLNRMFIEQKGILCLELLKPDGELIEVHEIHCSTEKDDIKFLGKKLEEEDDGEEQ